MADDFIHEIHNKNRIGYEFISNTFGLEYTTSIEVDRTKLNELLLRDRESLIKLNEFCHTQIYERIESLNGEKVIAELAIYILSPPQLLGLHNDMASIQSERTWLRSDLILPTQSLWRTSITKRTTRHWSTCPRDDKSCFF